MRVQKRKRWRPERWQSSQAEHEYGGNSSGEEIQPKFHAQHECGGPMLGAFLRERRRFYRFPNFTTTFILSIGLSLSLSEYKLCESSMVVCSLMAGRAEEAIGDPEKWVQDSDKSFHSNP